MVRCTWSFQDAKIRFSEVIEAARRRPQTVTKHGKPAVVIVAADEYVRLRKLRHLKAPSFTEPSLAMPQGDVEFERLNATRRDVDF
jgi:antitoxin Phd